MQFSASFGTLAINVQKWRFELLGNPFAVYVENASNDLEVEFIKLQLRDTTKTKYDAVGAAQLPHFISDSMP